jgi:hypothetical protein
MREFIFLVDWIGGTYADELPGIVHGGFLLELLYNGGFDFLLLRGGGGRGRGGRGTEETHFDLFI